MPTTIQKTSNNAQRSPRRSSGVIIPADFAKKEKRAVSDKDMANAKGGKIKVYAKGGGVRKSKYSL